jgi:hypothetical protein
MALTSTAVQDRRRFARLEAPPRIVIDLLQSDRRLPVDAVNISEAGLCLRLEERLEVRSLVNLQVTPGRRGPARAGRPVRCEGRVAWVIQRLDLREAPPYLFDVGIEFADPPAFLQRLISPRGRCQPTRAQASARIVPLVPAQIRGRQFVPKLERTPGSKPEWHLIVSIDSVPCFSERYLSERAAKAGWETFRRRQARRGITAGTT